MNTTGTASSAPPPAALRVLLVEDQQIVRRGLLMLLGTLPGLEIVGEAADGREALAQIRHTGPDVVVTDARMPVMDGVELVARCRAEHPDLPVLILTTFDDDDIVSGALAAGASGFLLKDTSTDALGEAIRAVAAGGLVIDPRVARTAMRAHTGGGDRGGDRGGDTGAAGDTPAAAAETRQNAPSSPLALLTRTERLVAAHVATGATNTEIAAALNLAEGTVKNHVSALLRKLDARDRTALALLLHHAFAAGQTQQT